MNARLWAQEHLRGIWFCPHLPFDDEYKIDEQAVGQIVERLLAMESGGISYSLVTEPWSCLHEERMRGAEVMGAAIGKRAAYCVSIMDHSVAETIRLGQHAFDHAGADAVLLGCPYEWAKGAEMATDYYRYVARRMPGPVIIWNSPRAGSQLGPDEVVGLMEIEQICAVKNALADPTGTQALLHAVGTELVVTESVEANYLNAIIATGQKALFSTTASHLMQTPKWQPIRDYASAAQRGELNRAEAIFEELEPLRDLWLSLYSGLSELGFVNPLAATKHWQGLMGMPGGTVRPPLRQVGYAEKKLIRSTLLPYADRFGLDLD